MKFSIYDDNLLNPFNKVRFHGGFTLFPEDFHLPTRSVSSEVKLVDTDCMCGEVKGFTHPADVSYNITSKMQDYMGHAVGIGEREIGIDEVDDEANDDEDEEDSDEEESDSDEEAESEAEAKSEAEEEVVRGKPGDDDGDDDDDDEEPSPGGGAGGGGGNVSETGNPSVVRTTAGTTVGIAILRRIIRDESTPADIEALDEIRETTESIMEHIPQYLRERLEEEEAERQEQARQGIMTSQLTVLVDKYLNVDAKSSPKQRNVLQQLGSKNPISYSDAETLSSNRKQVLQRYLYDRLTQLKGPVKSPGERKFADKFLSPAKVVSTFGKGAYDGPRLLASYQLYLDAYYDTSGTKKFYLTPR